MRHPFKKILIMNYDSFTGVLLYAYGLENYKTNEHVHPPWSRVTAKVEEKEPHMWDTEMTRGASMYCLDHQ